MEAVLLLLFLAAGGGFVWLQQVYLPRRERERASAWLDAADDGGTDRVRTYQRNHVRGRGSHRKTTRYEGARAALRPPWDDLTVEIGPSHQHMPEGVTPVRVDDPREVDPMWLWVSDPTCQERLSDLTFSRSLRRFMMEGEGDRTLLNGMVQAERIDGHSDALGLAALQSDVADVLYLLDQA